MGTNLIIKFLTITASCILLIVDQEVKSSTADQFSVQGLNDTIPETQETIAVPDSLTIRDADTTGLYVPNRPMNDTISGMEMDTLSERRAQRQSGSAVILDTRVDYSATDSIPFDILNQRLYLYGNAELTYGTINLKAAYITIDFNKNELYARGMADSTGTIQGKPVFQDGDQNFESQEMRYNFETKKGRTTKVFTEEAEGYMHGNTVKMMENKEIHIQSGKFTTCDNPNPHFHIGFQRAKLIPNDKIITSIAFLTIEGVRTPLFLPFGFFPNKQGQASGIIIPTYGEENNRGFFLQDGGFYWAINDYLDLKLTGDIYSRGSWGLDVGSNYRKRYKFSGRLGVSYNINIFGEEGLPNYSRSRDFRIQWSHSQDPKARPNSVFRANVNAGSSQQNRFNPTSSGQYLSNTFSSNVSYSANWAGKYNFSANMRHNQNTITQEMDLSLPEIAFSVSRFYPLRRRNPEGKIRWYEEITMNYQMNASNQIKTNEEDFFTEAMFSDMKNGVQHSIPISHSFRVLKHFNLSNSINYNERWYFQRVEQTWESDELPQDWEEGDPVPGSVVRDTVPGFYGVRDFSYSASLNTRLYGMVNFRKGPVTAVRHVLNPSVGFSYRPDFSTEFWGYYDSYENPNREDPVEYSYFQGFRYGTPSSGRSGSLNYSITNNLEMKVKSKKDTVTGVRKIALIDNLSLSGSYDFARDSLNLSDIRVSGRTRLFGQFDVTYGSSWSFYAADSNNRPYNQLLINSKDKLLEMRNTSWAFNLNYTFDSKDQRNGNNNTNNRMGDNMEPGGMGDFGQDEDLPFGSESDINEDETELPDQREEERPPAEHGIDLSIPWSVRFSYSFNYNANRNRFFNETERKVIQNLNVSGDVRITPNWRIGLRTGYDFEQNEITYTSVDIYRDLHCWELSINWIPFGFRKSYSMTLRVKSSTLQDLKLERRTNPLDRAFP